MEMVFAAGGSVELNLGRQVASRVLFRKHVLRGDLAVPQVAFRVSVKDTARYGRLVLLVSPDA
eukprot:scaffold441527_cov42-Prasinocladus_malaysianus.AAC.1